MCVKSGITPTYYQYVRDLDNAGKITDKKYDFAAEANCPATPTQSSPSTPTYGSSVTLNGITNKECKSPVASASVIPSWTTASEPSISISVAMILRTKYSSKDKSCTGVPLFKDYYVQGGACFVNTPDKWNTNYNSGKLSCDSTTSCSYSYFPTFDCTGAAITGVVNADKFKCYFDSDDDLDTMLFYIDSKSSTKSSSEASLSLLGLLALVAIPIMGAGIYLFALGGWEKHCVAVDKSLAAVKPLPFPATAATATGTATGTATASASGTGIATAGTELSIVPTPAHTAAIAPANVPARAPAPAPAHTASVSPEPED